MPTSLTKFSTPAVWLVLLAALALATSSVFAAGPVEFEFKVAPSEQNPFVRELWAEVVLPSGQVVNLPAFYAGENRFAVRARAAETGVYRLGKITEGADGRTSELTAKVAGRREKTVRAVQTWPAVKIDPADPRGFVLTSGEKFVPLGANLAWPDARGPKFYEKAFAAFSSQGLNWTRVWMSHWGGLNLDWLPEKFGPSPRGGDLDLRVAEDWDRVISAAESGGVYVQFVLQHHGQYSSQVNANWAHNPWNAANGGFLKSAAEFFTSPEAIRLTLQKYRYFVARWGYSPAIMSWELFNEVHWVDAMRGEAKDEAAVARWHSLMAGYLRSVDKHGHLVTTSTENLHSPIYTDMDYFQPHLYAPNLLAGARHFEETPEQLAKPVFYGEVGDDHLPVDGEVKNSGVTIVPPVWASLMGQGRFPAQAWLGRELMEKGRLHELGAAARFLAAAGFQRRAGLELFSPVIECETRVPLVLVGGYLWHPRPSVDLRLPLDGREPVEFANIPRIYMNAAESPGKGQSCRATFRVNFGKPATLRFRIGDSAAAASVFRFSVDGSVAAEAAWPELPKDAPAKGPRPQADLVASVPAGEHTLVVENPADTGWFDLTEIDLGLDQPVLASVGQRNADFVALWLWHRRGVFASKGATPAAGTLLFDELPAGTWRITWWDTLTGKPATPVIIEHAGGVLRVATPTISRHAAVVLERSVK